jgi:hypothetical protein
MRLKAEEWYAHADDGDNCAAPAVQGSFRGVLGGTFGALKAIIGNRWVLQDPRRRLLQCGWPTPAAIHQAQPLIWRSSRSGASAAGSRGTVAARPSTTREAYRC